MAELQGFIVWDPDLPEPGKVSMFGGEAWDLGASGRQRLRRSLPESVGKVFKTFLFVTDEGAKISWSVCPCILFGSKSRDPLANKLVLG